MFHALFWNDDMEKIRINKYISDAGFCSRREADQLIVDERVTINGVQKMKRSRLYGYLLKSFLRGKMRPNYVYLCGAHVETREKRSGKRFLCVLSQKIEHVMSRRYLSILVVDYSVSRLLIDSAKAIRSKE